MSGSHEVDALLAKLAKSPSNAILRVAVVRRLGEIGATSQALSAAFALDPADVVDPADRAFIANIFAQAGLDDDAAAWRGDQPVDDTAPADASDDGAAASYAGVPSSRDAARADAAEDAPEETRGRGAAQPAPARGGDGRPILRVVGGAQDPGPAAPPPDPPDKPITFRDVGGLDDVKRDIERRIIAPFKQSGLLSKFRKRAGGGVLLYGPPGCGKTLMAKATAGECDMKFLPVSIPEILDPYSGVAERRLSGFFETARNSAPTVLFFDEIDALASKRTAATSTHIAQLVSHFLAEMDGIGKNNDGVLVLAATNTPWSLDGAFLRPGRFDRMFFAPPPDRAAREAILRLELAERPAAADLNLKALAEATSGLSGADLSQIIERAADRAIDATLAAGAETPIDDRMLRESAKEVRSSVTEWFTTARNYATYSNESGRYDDVLAFLQKHGRD